MSAIDESDTKVLATGHEGEYVFETSFLKATVWAGYPRTGVHELIVKDLNHNVVRAGDGIFLWPEYYMRRGFSRRGAAPHAQSRARQTRWRLEDKALTIVYPAEEDWKTELQVTHRISGRCIDSEYAVTSSIAHPQFELFVASYVDSAYTATFVQAQNVEKNDGWIALDNRRHLWGAFMVSSGPASAARQFDGRWDFIRDREAEHANMSLFHFKRPMMIIWNERRGESLVFMAEPDTCTLIAGQHHETDTAHDFSLFGLDLEPRKQYEARVRLVVAPPTLDRSTLLREAEARYEEFLRSKG